MPLDDMTRAPRRAPRLGAHTGLSVNRLREALVDEPTTRCEVTDGEA